ncbi:MAG: ferrous iron transporter B [Kiritimatiellae bacterium]|nr:ferrous iron transporter B [Kiritimatiellia bacterium]
MSTSEKKIVIALAGNPNCGKTTLFNSLTGGTEYVGNWPGVTVEKKDGPFKKHDGVVIQDLPGIYSLSPYSKEEVVARNYLVEQSPDVILNIVDGTNLERNLYLTTQLMELGLPMVVAVNMADVLKKAGDVVDVKKLSQELHCPVVEISALKEEGSLAAAELALELAKSGKTGELPHVYKGSVEHAVAHIEESIEDKVPAHHLRWFAIKLFERDSVAQKRLSLPGDVMAHIEQHVADCEKELDDDAESIITNQRYAYIATVVGMAVKKKARKGNLTTSDKIDRVVTNRWLALPIFAAIIWIMYYVSVTTVGTWLTDWANDGLFGDGWFLAWTSGEKGGREAWDEASGAFAEAKARIAAFQEAYSEAAGAPAEAAEAEKGEDAPAFVVADEALAATITRTFRLEDEESGEVTNYPEALQDLMSEKGVDSFSREELLAFVAENGEAAGVKLAEGKDGPALETIPGESKEAESFPLAGFVADYGSYQEALEVEEPEPSDYGVWVPGIPVLAEKAFAAMGIPEDGIAHGIVFDAIIGGVGTVLGFVPQILIVFLFLAFLEDCGYMARIAFIMDRIFRRFGLSGKSFIPIMVGMGCGVPAIMATRTIEQERDRRMTIMLTTYLPCGAKAAIIAMFVPAFFGGSAWAATAMYFLGIAVIVFGGIALKKTRPFLGDPAPFVMELPAYHWPSLRGVLIHTWERTKAYMVKAGTLIFAASVVLWFLMSFNWRLSMVGLEESILHDIGVCFAWIFAPLGFGRWEGAVASVTALIAKEQATATLAMLAEPVAAVGGTLAHVRALFGEFSPAYPVLAALSFMIMNLFDPPCIVAIMTTFREIGGARWGWFAVLFQILVGYCLALVTYQLGKWVVYGASFGAGTAAAIVVVVLALFFIVRPAPKGAAK